MVQNPSLTWRRRSETGLGIHRRGAEGAEISAELNATDQPVVEWSGQHESVILTRRRGDAEIRAEKQREGENERGDSGGTSPSVRRGRVSGEERGPSCARVGRLQSELRSDGQGGALSHNAATRKPRIGWPEEKPANSGRNLTRQVPRISGNIGLGVSPDRSAISGRRSGRLRRRDDRGCRR